MGKSTISMAIFNSYVSLPEGSWGGAWLRALWSRLHRKRSDLVQVLSVWAFLPKEPGITRVSWYSYGSIPINTIFNGMNIHLSQLFWCELQGYKVLTHCHMAQTFNMLNMLLECSNMFNIQSDELFWPFLLPSWAGNTSTIKTIGSPVVQGPRTSESREEEAVHYGSHDRSHGSEAPEKKSQGNCDLGFDLGGIQVTTWWFFFVEMR